MIEHTFSILSGIGEKKERAFWRRGVLTWENFLNSETQVSATQKALWDDTINEATERHEDDDAEYFSNLLPKTEHWRLFDKFRDSVVCLDIESNGRPADTGGYTTVVGLYDKKGYASFVHGENMDVQAIQDRIDESKILVTFYGSVFDIPFMEKTLPGFKLNILHFDLCFGLKRLGIKGGLKKIEPQFGIERDESTEGLDGYAAVLLWRRARRGDKGARDLLVAYNKEDTENLMHIARESYNMLRDSSRNST